MKIVLVYVNVGSLSPKNGQALVDRIVGLFTAVIPESIPVIGLPTREVPTRVEVLEL